MGMDTVQSTLQLSSTCSTYWEENYLHAWWHWKVNTLRGTDRENWEANNNGCWIHSSNGPPVVCPSWMYCVFLIPLVLLKMSHTCFIFRSDPTENDSIEGLRPNARGPGLVTFGVCPMQQVSIMTDCCFLCYFGSSFLHQVPVSNTWRLGMDTET